MEINFFASDLIKSFFKKLNHEEIQYAVLRNYEKLPDANDSKDVDIIVAPNNLREAFSVLKESAKENNYQLIWKNKLDYLTGVVFVKIEDGNVFSVKIDLFSGFKWRGCTYIKPDIILNSTENYNGFKVPAKAHEAFIMIVYYIFYARKIKLKYLEPIDNNANNNLNAFSEITKLTFPESLAEKILFLVKSHKIKELVSLRNEMRSSVIKYSFRHENLILSFFKHVKTEYWNRKRFGTLIAFSGPDGAGKSTLVDAVMELFCSLGINANTTPHHLLSKNIPSLHKLPGAPKKYAKQDYTKPYQAKTAGLLSSTVRTTYYFFTFLLDRKFYIKKELKKNHVVIFDRYYTDLMADPTRIRIGLKKSLVQKVFNALQSPNFTFIILADKEKILNRKDELKEEKLVELLLAYENLQSIVPNCKILYNNGSVDDGKLMICQNVFNKLEEKNRKR